MKRTDIYPMIAACVRRILAPGARAGELEELAGQIWRGYGRSLPADAVQRWGALALRGQDGLQDRASAERTLRTVTWRVGLLAALLAAHGAERAGERLTRLVCRLVPAGETPSRETVERLLALAEGERSLEETARRVLWALEGGRQNSLSSIYSHPVDSRLVKLLDTPAVNGMFRALVDFSADTAMGQMLAASIPVNAKNYAALDRIVEDCVERLEIRRPYVVVTNHLPGINAVTFGSDEEPYIAITSLMVKIMKEDAMRFVIGHECGHIAMGHVIYHTAANALGSLSQLLPLAGPLISQSLAYPLNAWSRRSEITADRAGFLCCGSVETAKRTLLQLESALVPAEELDIEGYMESSRRFLDKGVLRRLGEYGSSHPLTPKRIAALDLFAQSAACRQAQGLDAPADAMPTEELDRRTEEIVKVL